MFEADDDIRRCGAPVEAWSVNPQALEEFPREAQQRYDFLKGARRLGPAGFHSRGHEERQSGSGIECAGAAECLRAIQRTFATCSRRCSASPGQMRLTRRNQRLF